MTALRGWGGRVLAGGLLAACIGAVVVASLSGFRLKFLVLNADALYLPTLLRDLIELGGRWSDWYLTPAPYVFPDYALFGLAYLLGDSAFHQMLAYMVMQIGLTAALSWWVARRAGAVQAWWPAVLTTAMLSYLAIGWGQPYVFMLMSAFHYSVFLFGLLLLAVLLKPLPDGELSRGVGMWLLAVASFLMALSDALVMVQVVLPVGAWLLVRAWAGELAWRAAIRWNLALVVSGMVGMLSYSAIIPKPTRLRGGLALDLLPAKAMAGLVLVWREVAEAPLLIGITVGFYVLAAYCVVSMLRRRVVTGVPSAVVNLSAFALIAGAANLAASLPFAGLEITPRYFIPAACLPLLVISIWVALALRERTWAMAAPTVMAAAGLASAASLGVAQHGLPADHYPADVACIDAALDGTGLKNGLTNYWDAKRVGAFSHHDLRLAQYLNSMDEFKWITSQRHYRPAYDFAIVAEDSDAPAHRMSVQTIEKVAGPAQRVVVCGLRTLMIYGQDGLKLGAAK